MTRRPRAYVGTGTPVAGDVHDRASLDAALAGVDIAYYLVHSLDHRDFVARDAAAAASFGRAAGAAGVRRIVYLGGLGDDGDDLSPHLRSRREVETLLGAGGIPVTTLRAGIVIGDGGTSWELIRAMVARVPVLAVPRWATTRTQPIALDDVIRYLVGVLTIDDRQSHVYEIGGADVMRYVDMLSRVSALQGRPTAIVPVPVPSARLATFVAAQALPLITGVDGRTIAALLASMKNEVIVRDPAIRTVVPFDLMDYDAAVLAALAERQRGRLIS